MNTKLINNVSNGEFPQRGQYFYVERSDGIRDYSYIDDVFECSGEDVTLVVARCLTDLRTENYRFNRKHYTFLPVGEEVLNTIGICLGDDDVLDAHIITDKANGEQNETLLQNSNDANP